MGLETHATTEIMPRPISVFPLRSRDAIVGDVNDAFSRREVKVRQGAYLPHWTLQGATYHVVFRLADSLPAEVVEGWRRERAELLARSESPGADCAAMAGRLQVLFSERIERFLDAGHGACWLRRPEIAELVANSLRHFDGERYDLASWCVMPNHVHAVVLPFAGDGLPAILKGWKGFSARAANRALRRSGEFWQPEYYDHLIRDENEFVRVVRYVLGNPEAAGLKDWRWKGCSARVRALAERQ